VSLRGVVPPLVTPFRPDGSLDLPAFEANLGFLKGFDLSGFLVLGSNGEAAGLEEAEKLDLVVVARRSLPGRFLLVGTGVESTRGTVALTRRAADAGADAALVLTPHYYRSRMTEEALRRHYEAVADASPIPVYLYSVPAFTGLVWPPDLAGALADHPRIAGIKESSGDLSLLARIVSTVPPTFTVACGNAPVLYPALCVGAAGGVVAVANCVPGVATALFAAFRAGDHERARRLQEALTPLAVAVTATWGVAGLKAAMDFVGLRGGAVRAPLLPVGDAVREQLRPLLDRAQAAV
jgi:4-hydroxy-2-oxoglutarate aldolase